MACETLEAGKSAALLSLHAFTSCCQTSKLCGKSTLTCWKVFTAASENIINSFQRLCDSEDDKIDSIRDGLV